MLCILIITELWLNNLDIVLFLNSLIIPDSHGITVDSYFLSCVSFLPLIGCLSYLKNNSKFWVRQMQMIPKSWIHHCDMVMFLGKLRPPPPLSFFYFLFIRAIWMEIQCCEVLSSILERCSYLVLLLWFQFCFSGLYMALLILWGLCLLLKKKRII